MDLIVRSPRLYSRHLRIDVRSLPGVLKRDLIFTRILGLFLQAPAHVVVAFQGRGVSFFLNIFFTRTCSRGGCNRPSLRAAAFQGSDFSNFVFSKYFFFGYRHLRTRWLRSTKLACCSISRKRRAEVLMCSAFIPSTLLCGVYKCR